MFMKEDFLHYVWRNKQFDVSNLVSEQNQKIEIVRFGDYLQSTGPDFFNAQLYIDKQLWAGNVEMHLKASDWYLHQHQTDSNYDNVILHVVWDHDIEVFRKDGSVVPVLNLSKYVHVNLVKRYFDLRTSKTWIYCENQLDQIDDFTWSFWKEKLLIERLEFKSKPIETLLQRTQNNWEEVFFILLTKNFGLNINGVAFEETAKCIGYKTMSKERFDVFKLEALFFGVSGLLQIPKQDVYYNNLKNEFTYLQAKHHLNDCVVEPVQFFKLRPDNFPTIRFAQLASLLHQNEHLFTDLITKDFSQKDLYACFSISISDYWKNHYVFDKVSKISHKKLTTAFIDLVFLNTILPLRFVYLKHIGRTDFDDVFEMYRNLKYEKNAIVDRFKDLKVSVESAFDSQALIQLKKNYCDEKKCLQCAVAIQLLKNNA